MDSLALFLRRRLAPLLRLRAILFVEN